MKLLLSTLFFSQIAFSQNVIFKSGQAFTQKQLGSFYSSLALQDSLLLFNAADYKLYAYHAYTGQVKWEYYLGWKSNISPFFAGNFIWARSNEVSVQLNKDGSLQKKLPFSVETKPLLKNKVLYTTAIYENGCLLAYDLEKDSVLWQRFLAHGCSRQPYYLDSRIIANAEGDSWLDISYDGRLKNEACEKEEVPFPSELSCAETFVALTHDQQKLRVDAVAKLNPDSDDSPQVFTTAQHTFLLTAGKLAVLGNRQKKKYAIDLSSFFPDEETGEQTTAILQADDSKIRLLYNNHLLTIDHQKKKLLQQVNLQAWMPHHAVLQGNHLWLISKNDGLLYGLRIP